MPFKTPDGVKQSEKGLFGIGGQTAKSGQQLTQSGTGNLNNAAGFFRTMLNGNRANTTAALQPSINQTNETYNGALQTAANTMPRGGARFSTLFQLPFAKTQAINSMYGQARAAAPGALAGIGGQQLGAGQGLFNVGSNAYSDAGRIDLQNQQMKDQSWTNLGKGIFGLATMPLGGWAGTLGGALGGAAGSMARTPPFWKGN